jgi:spore coat polysaccharide biosynthesis protein SpsF
MNQTFAIIEARMTSSRLPGKVLMQAAGKPLLQILIERLRRCQSLDGIIVATTINATDDPIEELCGKLGAGCFRGSEENVLERVCQAAQKFDVRQIVEITGDCPLVDPWQVDHAVEIFLSEQPFTRYLSNVSPGGDAPQGMNVQVFKSEDLLEILSGDPDELDREHVSYGFYREENRGKYRPVYINYPPPLNRPDIWVTLDYEEDYQLIKQIYEELSAEKSAFTLRDVVEWVDATPALHQKCKNLRGLE